MARFVSVDPIIDKFPYLTPYNYASNDPVKNIDLWGLQGVRAERVGPGNYTTAQSSTYIEPRVITSISKGPGTIRQYNPTGLQRLESKVETGEANLVERVVYELVNGPTMAITEFVGEGKTVGGQPLTGTQKQDAAAEFAMLALGELGKGVSVLVGEGLSTLDEALGIRRFNKKERSAGLEKAKDTDGTPRCEYCGEELTEDYGFPNSYEADHREPFSKGGETTQKNLAPACRTCNRSKGAKTTEEWDPKL